MSNRLDKDREAELQPQRIKTAKLAIENLGHKIIFESDTEVRFMYQGEIIHFWPYSGWHSGQSIKAGRGLQHLLEQIIG